MVPIQPREVPAAFWATSYLFCVLCAYYMLRAVRDEIGAEHRELLPDYWTWGFVVVLVLTPVYASVSRWWPRQVFVPAANRFFNLNLIGLYALFWVTEGEARALVAGVFYVWLSAFVMFMVSVFWGLMADVFRAEQGKRLFGLLAFGGSLGGVVGSGLTAVLVEHTGRIHLFLIPIALLELTCLCAGRVHRHAGDAAPGSEPAEQSDASRPVPGNPLRGLGAVVRDPYLLGIAAFLTLYTFGSTMLYFEKAELARAAFADRDARTAFYARIDYLVNGLALCCQLLITGRVIPRLGVGRTLMALPAITLLGFAALAAAPRFGVLIGFEVLRRSGEFALGKPAREVLFTVVARADKYRAKPFLDTVVYRGSDMLHGWLHQLLSAQAGLGLRGIAGVACGASLAWLWLAPRLGREQERRAAD